MHPRTHRDPEERRWQPGIRAAAALLAMSGLLLSASPAQTGGPGKTTEVVTRGHKSRGQGADPNIRHKSEVNDPGASLAPPAAKGGPKSRGSACGIVVDNWTPWKVQFYLDGDFQGVISPYGALSGVAFTGPTVVYARADFTDGTYTSWGPQTFQCAGQGVYRWKRE